MELPINPLFNVQEVQKMGMIINPYRFGGFAFPTNGLVAYYPFSGNANDMSGNGYNGTVDGATLATDRNGNTNNAYYFDGSNDKITLPNDVRQTSNFSISFWVNVESWTHQAYPSLFGGEGLDGNGSLSDIAITRSGANIHFDIYSSSKRNYIYLPHITYFPTGTYYLITFQYESNRYSRVYKDGVKIGESDIGNITITASLPVYVGYGRRDYFKGTIDSVWIYNRPLSTAEMATLI